MSAAAPKKTLTAAERQAKLQEMLAKEEREAAERKQKLTEQIAAQAAKAEAEAVAAAAKAQRNASLAAFGVPVMKKSAARMTAAQRLALMMAQNEGRATNVVDPAAVKKAAEEAFKSLAAPQKIEYLRAKAAADVAEAEAKLAVYRAKVDERLARDIAAVHKEVGDPAGALSDLVSAMASSSSMAASSSSMAASPSAAKAARRTTQQVFNNLQRELAYEEGRVARRARGEQVSPRLKKTLKTTPERVLKLRANLASSQMKLNSAATRKLASVAKKTSTKQKANSNAAALEAYMAARAEKKKAESGAASSRSNE
jgi:hypothetical protein